MFSVPVIRFALASICLGWMALLPAAVNAQGNAQKGQYIAAAAGCAGCHTETKAGSVPYAGGRALETPFGVFFGPNLTPDKETGLGNWTEADFKLALRHGQRRDGANYFPAFPYPSFTGMSDSDIGDLWAFLRSLPPTKKANRDHDLKFPFSLRVLVSGWKMLFFTPGSGGAVTANVPADALVARGAYLVRVLGHCGECHTPRNMFGGPKTDAFLGGAKIPEGKVPNITPTRLKKWKDSDLREYFATGTAPSGDLALDPMTEVITNTTSKWTKEDVDAVIAYLRSVAPQPESK